MMKRTFYILLSLIISLLAVSFTGCKKDKFAAGKTYYGFTMSETELTLDEGETHGLICSYGDKDIFYNSSDDGVATVNENGVITAVGVGVAYITATADAPDAQKTCKVTVVKNVYTVEIDREENLTAVTGAKLAFKATVYKNDEKTELSVSWSVTPSGLTIVADGDTATVTFSAAGEYTLKATYGNSSATVTVKVVNEIGGNE